MASGLQQEHRGSVIVGARAPEELEVMLEDAFVLREPAALVPLFEEAAIVSDPAVGRTARGSDAIAELIGGLWHERMYLAASGRVLQAGDTALTMGQASLSVMRRSTDRRWRYAILLLLADALVESKGDHT